MNLYLEQKVFSLKDKFTVYDANKSPVYTVEGKMVSIHNQHSVYNNNGEEVAHIHKKVISIMPEFFIERPLGHEIELKGKFAIGHEVFELHELDWKLKGKFLEHDYAIYKDEQEIASVHQKWLSWGDTYEIAVSEGVDEVLVLCVMICVDILHQIEGTTTAVATEDLVVDSLLKNKN